MADSKKKGDIKLADQLKRILQRLDSIEEQIQRNQTDDDESNGTVAKQCCCLPTVPERVLEAGIDPGRESLIRSIEKKWVNGTELKYYFFTEGDWGGSSSQQKVVKDAFRTWKNVGIGLSFKQVNQPDLADIRIGFKQGDGSWSYLGRDIWNRPVNERTMNFGWPLRGQDGQDTALHEIGHTLGFNHEQQNPFAGIQWDEEAVYQYFAGPPNYWPRNQTYHNILKTLDPNTVDGSDWDPNSIMQYAFGAGLILFPEEFRNGLNPEPGLSEIDKQRVRLFYPELEDDEQELKPFESRRLTLGPAEQTNFVIRPASTRRYSIQTFGISDTVMVLFEDTDGTLEHLAADDDSGWSRNARISVRLVRGRNYVLRLRLYSSRASGDSAVMIW
jgi:hypothetical protein